MKKVYPIILSKGSSDNYIVYIPDFHINTEGMDEGHAIEMARDTIGIVGIDMEDENEKLPNPTDLKNIETQKDDIITC